MVFSSLSFLFFFFPIVILLYYAINNRIWRNSVLLIASVLFYSWGDVQYLIIMIAVTLVAYVAGLLISREGKGHKWAFWMSIVLILGNLAVFKYLGFITENISSLFHISISCRELVLPLGISFYTFQILSYVIDLYFGRCSVQQNFFSLLLYVSFFPQLIAGPIVRYKTIESEIAERHENLIEFTNGLRRFVVGLAKKIIIANNMAVIADNLYAGNPAYYGALVLILASLAYSLQIYYDFSGYSDMAIGLGCMFGFHFPENFNYPYSALSVTDFWRRWHISLSTWFRDYLYIPLGGNRVSAAKWIRNLLIVWALTGLWHGASWNFVFWGLFYGLILIIEKKIMTRLKVNMPTVFHWLLTFLVVNLGWIIFALPDVEQLFSVLQRMVCFAPTDWPAVMSENIECVTSLLFIVPGVIFMFPVHITALNVNKSLGLLSATGTIILFFLCIIFLVSNSYNPFIYFRF